MFNGLNKHCIVVFYVGIFCRSQDRLYFLSNFFFILLGFKSINNLDCFGRNNVAFACSVSRDDALEEVISCAECCCHDYCKQYKNQQVNYLGRRERVCKKVNKLNFSHINISFNRYLNYRYFNTYINNCNPARGGQTGIKPQQAGMTVYPLNS